MIFKYRFTKKAGTDLEEILEYISKTLCNPTAAASLFKKVFSSIENLCVFPESGALLQNEFVADKTIRKVVVDNYLLYYKMDAAEKYIYTLRIVYGKINLETIYREF